ncbi:hypothetical protein PIIN_09258 [Serendipita indica DSM 11827]|uniref:Uncharacterized protein n=1 Tax=Serendipita indica (strain DSM 11827) TaxID=1109443 RepID=G4TVD1_SERID|nr:hypothetical protein PIIN_09258 [Serendipita indica DSM 11827]
MWRGVGDQRAGERETARKGRTHTSEQNSTRARAMNVNLRAWEQWQLTERALLTITIIGVLVLNRIASCNVTEMNASCVPSLVNSAAAKLENYSIHRTHSLPPVFLRIYDPHIQELPEGAILTSRSSSLQSANGRVLRAKKAPARPGAGVVACFGAALPLRDLETQQGKKEKDRWSLTSTTGPTTTIFSRKFAQLSPSTVAEEHSDKEFDEANTALRGQRLQDNWDLMYFNVLGTDMIIIHSLQVAKDLMEKRGAIHSGRPGDVMNYYVYASLSFTSEGV